MVKNQIKYVTVGISPLALQKLKKEPFLGNSNSERIRNAIYKYIETKEL